ncbi:MAG: adenylate kinase family protein [Thermoproteota archaeon]
MSSKRKFLVVTGTPGTGKSAASKLLAAELRWMHIDLGKLASRKRLFKGYDRKRGVPVADLGKIKSEVLRAARRADRTVILDGSYSHLVLPKSLVIAAVVLRCSPNGLARRLRRKGWGERKIRENVQSEILGVCESEAMNVYGKVCEIDTTGKGAREVCREIVSMLMKGSAATGSFDWLPQVSDRIRLRWMA